MADQKRELSQIGNLPSSRTALSGSSTLHEKNESNRRSVNNTFNTIDLQHLSLLSGNYPVEQADWIDVNEQLRSRGFTPITLAKSSSNHREGFNVFDEEASNLLRKTLLHLLQENEKRQKTIQAKDGSTKKNFKSVASSPIKQYYENEKKFRNDERHDVNKWDMTINTPTFEEAIETDYRLMLQERYKERIDVLQTELDELRNSLQNMKSKKTLEHAMSTTNECNSTYYPNQTKADCHSIPVETQRSKKSQDTNPSLATLRVNYFDNETSPVKKYKKKCAALKSKIHLLKLENLQLHSTIKSLEATQKRTKLSTPSPEMHHKWKSTVKKNTDSMLHFDLQKIYSISSTSDLQECLEKIQEWKRQEFYCSEIEKLLEKVNEIVTNNQSIYIKELDSRMNLITTLIMWRADRDQLKDILVSLKHLYSDLVPWKDFPEDGLLLRNQGPIQDILSLLQKIRVIVEQRGPPVELDASNNLTHDQLKTLVEHFMKLFDVRNGSAVYTRMHDVYVRYFEMLNVLRSLRAILHLKKDSSTNEVVNAVGRLSKARHLLHVEKLDSVIKQVEEYDRFYGSFHQLVQHLMKLLGVSHLDHIVPVIKSLLQGKEM